MGAKNVSACYVLWGHLDHAPFRLLVGMALQSLDHQGKTGRPARIWFGGQDALVDMLGRSRTQAYEALKKLKDAGAVEVIDAGRVDHRAVYKLVLDPLAVSGLPGPTSVRNTRTKRVPPTRNRGSRTPGPLGTTEEGTAESRPGDKSLPAVISPALVGPVDNPEFDEMDKGTANQLLIKRYGVAVHELLAQHAAVHADCENPAGHVLAITPTFRVIEGGKTA